MAKKNLTRPSSYSALSYSRYHQKGKINPVTKVVAVLSLLSAIAISGCGGRASFTAPPVTLASAQLFNDSMIGQTWTFPNGYGDQTFITPEAAPDPVACNQGHNILLHYTKTAARAYWAPGVDGAEDTFVAHQDPDGSWRGIADIPAVSGVPALTEDVQMVAGEQPPYNMLPASITSGQVISIRTHYHRYIKMSVNTFDCIVDPSTEYGIVDWSTDFSVDNCDTPAYQGPCVLVDSHEDCVHEMLWVAPGVGFVKIQPIDRGNCLADIDPNLTMVRVH